MSSTEGKFTNKICRICLKESDDMKWLFTKIDDTRTTFVNILENVMNLSLNVDENHPQQICNECQHVIIMADDFKRKCLRSEAVLYGNCNASDQMHPKAETELEQPYQCSICMMKFSDLLLLGSHVLYHQNDQLLLIKPTNSDIISIETTASLVKEENTQDMCLNHFDTDSVDYKEEYNNSPNYKLETEDDKRSIKFIMNNPANDDALSLTLDTGNKRIPCTKCNKLLSNLQTYQRHQKTHEDNKETAQYKCSLCERTFKKKSKLSYHLKIHDKANFTYPCKICKLVFKHQAFLENHILALHTKEKGYECEICHKTFATEDSLKVHKDGHQLKKHYCKFCEKGFVMLSTLNDHMRTHTGEKPFLCNICGKNFSQKNNMLQHVRRHKGVKAFSCNECEKSFVSKGELVSHARTHSGAHPFVCDHCGNGFTTASSLVKHKRIHTGEKPYACDLCSMRFSALGTMKNHRRRHTGEKPYQCSHCDKAFVQKNDLVSHIRCHTGERPYICTNCGQSFRKSSALKTHAKTHLKGTLLRDNMTLMQGVKVIMNDVP